MNTYAKYCPNVFLAKCEEQYQKGDIITVTTKYGKENECEVHNLILVKDGFYYHSITRTDGFNSQERAKRKAQNPALIKTAVMGSFYRGKLISLCGVMWLKEKGLYDLKDKIIR